MVELPVTVDMSTAYDGSSRRRPRRALAPLERDVVCRVLNDVLHHITEHGGDLSCLAAVPIRGFTQDEYHMLINVREAIDPRRD